MTTLGKRDAMDGLLRQSLAQQGRLEKQACPEAEILAAYFDRLLSEHETARCETHFAVCARCREQLAVMLRGESPQPVRGRSLWDWRWLAATAAVLALALTWEVGQGWRPISGRKQAKAPLVSMWRPDQKPLPLPSAGMQTPGAPQVTSRHAPTLSAGDKETNRFQSDAGPSAHAPDKKQSSAPRSEGIKRDSVPSTGLETALGPAWPAKEVGTASGAGNSAPPNTEALTLSSGASNRNGPPIRIEASAAKAETAEHGSVAILIRTPDAKVLWRVTGGGFIERTVDGGATWHGQLADANAQLTSGAAPTAKVCWLVGSNGAILLTKDAMSWKKIPPPIPADFTAVTAQNASSATITAADGQKFRTTDSGKRWLPAK